MNKSLKVIWLSDNEINTVGVKGIFELLIKNQNIEEIWLDNNSINYECGLYICDMLMNNTTLKNIYLRKNNFDKKSIIQINDTLKFNRVIEYIYFTKDNFNDYYSYYSNRPILNFRIALVDFGSKRKIKTKIINNERRKFNSNNPVNKISNRFFFKSK